ncbi:MAG: D-3-phosphoglycerate dehydrogenase [Candidatus Hydrogenedentota bacterium]
MFKILALDNLSEEGLNIFREAEGFQVDVKPPQKPEELAAILGDYDGLVVRSATKVTAAAIEKAGRLRVIGRAGAGTDNVDKDAATKRGIVVMNVPGGNTISTCEHTFALMLSLCRNIPQAHASMMEGRWDRKNFNGAEVRGKTLGVLGCGRIGGAVAKRALAFEMKVLVFDPLLSKLKAEALGVELATLDEIIERSDFITIHAPKTEKTMNMIRMEQLKRMKPNCRIVNCARGGLVNEQDLAQALREGVIAGAALDVYTSEPIENNPFLGLTNVVTTPHLAASTEEAQLTVAIEVAQQMVDYLKTGAIVNAVNVPSLDAETRKALQPILNLGSRLGCFASQYMRGKPTSVEIEYAGEIGVTDTYPISAAVLVGFLTPLVETVNSVSAPTLLETHGITYSETRSPQNPDYAFQISIRVSTDLESHDIAGTLSNNQEARICSIDGIRVDTELVSWMLICVNEDKPLVFGRVATAIGEAGVNIANLALGRDTLGGRATAVLNVDADVDLGVIDAIRRIPHVIDARLVEV